MAVERRFPAVEKSIDEITHEDIRVKVLGTVIDRQADTVVIDDGTGKIKSTFYSQVENIEISQTVRIFGRVMPQDNGFELQGEVIQNMDGLDHSLLKKIRKLGG